MGLCSDVFHTVCCAGCLSNCIFPYMFICAYAYYMHMFVYMFKHAWLPFFLHYVLCISFVNVCKIISIVFH